MALSDELADLPATELALRIRRRDLSPVEVMEAFIARIEARHPSLNALIYLGFEDARARAKEAEQALISGAEIRPLYGEPTAIKDLFDSKPGWKSTFGGVRALKDFIPDFYCAFAERIERAGAILLGKTNSPVMGLSRHLRPLPVRALAQSLRSRQERLLGRQRRRGRRRPAAARRRHRWPRLDSHPGLVVRRLRLQAVVRPPAVLRGAQRLRRHGAVPVRGSDHPHGRGRGAGAHGACRARSARSLQPGRAE